jgi:galactokinase
MSRMKNTAWGYVLPMPSISSAPHPATPASGLDRVIALFKDWYDTVPTVIASAPGRVNLIGEHLDYNGGPVLLFAIARRTWVAAGAAPGFTMASSAVGHHPVYRPEGPSRGDWSDYVMGVVRELRSANSAPGGARLAVVSDIQPGAGLSSSAALAVATAAALGRLAGRELAPEMLADVAFRAEHDYVGVRCGRMDQTVIAHAVEGTAMFFDTATSERSTSPFPFRIWIIPTGVDHALADGGYNARRRECESALDRCRQRWPDLPSLAALDPMLLPEAVALLPAPLDRRARHVVTEAARTRRADSALGEGNLVEVGHLLVQGHESLQADFESSIEEADFLVDLGLERGALGARLTGAGWGGSVVMLAPESIETEVMEGTATAFARRFGRMPAAWSTHASGGVRLDLVA